MKILVTSLLIVLFMVSSALAAPTLVPTFESIGITWNPGTGEGLSNEAKVEYKKTADSTWIRAHSLWYDSRAAVPGGEYRGSIVGLDSGTSYDVKCTLQSAPGTSEQATVSTWSETSAFGIGSTTYVNNRSTTLTITSADSGSAGSYHLYTHSGGGATIDVNGGASYNIILESGVHHIIIRDLKLDGANWEAITLGTGVHDIVIEDNEITGWAEACDGSGIYCDGNDEDYLGAISYGWKYGNCSAADGNSPLRIIIQRNWIHEPAHGSKSWEFGHPEGPMAVYFCDNQTNNYSHLASMGNHVIRYNTIEASTDHYFNDAMGGGSNFSWQGFPGRDSDIYGNYISGTWDECIEAEGANENVRIWGNYCDKFGMHIGLAANTVGPSYVFRNVSDESRYSTASDDSDDESNYFRGPFIKGGNKTFSSGRSYVYHNVTLQQDAPGKTYSLGSLGISGTWGGGNTYEMVIANNILISAWGPKSAGGARMGYAIGSGGSNLGDYNLIYNLFSPVEDPDPHYDLHANLQNPTANEQHGSTGLPTWESGHGDEAGSTGLYETTGANSKDAGVVIWGFNDANSKWPYAGSAPDIGVSETGMATWEFGKDAYREDIGSPPRAPTGLHIANQ